jgi:hypothetical protein
MNKGAPITGKRSGANIAGNVIAALSSPKPKLATDKCASRPKVAV